MVGSKLLRTFVHPATRMEETIRRAGFTLAARRETWMWTADVYIQVRVGLGGWMGTGTGARLADEDVRAIEAIHERWMADELAGDATAVLRLCTEDVVWMPPGARLLRGRQTILNWLSGPPVQIHDLRLSNLEIAGDGRVAWKTCEFVTTYQLNGAHPTVDQGSHLWILRKDDHGVWRVVVATWTLR